MNSKENLFHSEKSQDAFKPKTDGNRISAEYSKDTALRKSQTNEMMPVENIGRPKSTTARNNVENVSDVVSKQKLKDPSMLSDKTFQGVKSELVRSRKSKFLTETEINAKDSDGPRKELNILQMEISDLQVLIY